MRCPNEQTITRDPWPGMRPDLGGVHLDRKTNKPRVTLSVPCGKCHTCASLKSAQWAVRAYHESQLHSQNCFMTLTYDDDHYPADGKISLAHLQAFWRELRRLVSPHKIRYLACGEYGELTHRAHYHALIFGSDFREGAETTRPGGYTNSVIESIWGHGLIDIAPLSMATCCYVAGYATKKIGNPDTFVRMSTRPGLGHGWLDLYSDEIRANQSVVIDGQTLPIPKRYMEWEDFNDIKEYNQCREKKARTVPIKESHRANALSKFKHKVEKL